MSEHIDITGWREELDELRQSDAYVIGWADNEFGEVWKPVPISKVHEFAELVLSNEELRHCLTEVNKWYQEDPERTCIADDENNTYPISADSKVYEFYEWFLLKNGLGPNSEVGRTGFMTCLAVESGFFNSTTSNEAIAYMKNHAEKHIVWDC